ncbi:MAG: DUF4175 family protein, partial [Pseudomonadota bacterium]
MGAAQSIWPALWPGLPVLLLFCGIGLAGGWQALPLWLHLPALLATLGVTGWMMWRVVRGFHWPSLRQGLIRIEHASGLGYQPLRKRSGGPVHGDAAAQALWQAHLSRLKTPTVKAPWPGISQARSDRYALSALALVALITGLSLAGRHAPERLVQTFLPDMGGAPANAVVTVTATPPKYVGVSPLVLSAFSAEEQAQTDMPLPVGTTLELSVAGGWRTPSLKMAQREIEFERVGKSRYVLRISAMQSDGLEVQQGSRIQFRWNSPIVVDQAPAIAFSELPKRTTNHALQISYEVFDDYGIEDITLLLTPQEAQTQRQRIAIAAPQVEPGALETRRIYKNLTASKWAGRPVTLALTATDGLQQVGKSGPIEAILPERPFSHPLAKQLIAQRKRLFFESGSRLKVAKKLGEMSQSPAQFDDSLWAYAMLRSAYYRLGKHRDTKIVAQVTDQMWAIATFLEDGGLTAQRDALRQSLEEMMSALENQDAQAFDALAQ